MPPQIAKPAQHLADPKTRLALRIQHRTLDLIRAELTRQGFTELLAPIVGPVTDPGTRGAKQGVLDYYGHEYRIMSSGILYKQLAITAFDKMFFVAPNLRLEPPETANTGRHLSEFYQIDVEIANADYDQAMDVAETMVMAANKGIKQEFGDQLQAIGRDLPDLSPGFPRLTHQEAVKQLHDLGRQQDPLAEIRWQEEEFLSKQFQTPFFIKDYPKGSRGFYDLEDPQRPGILRDFDLLMPGGYGEVVSGAEREHEYARIIARMRETGENPAKYGWYTDLLRDGIPPSAGFGLGVERITRYLTGLDAVWKTRPWPKLPGLPCP